MDKELIKELESLVEKFKIFFFNDNKKQYWFY